MRLIDADVFISYLKEAVKGKDTLNVLIMEAVIGMVNVMADNEPVNQWIPCSESLPEERDSIFAKLYGTEKWRNAMFRRSSRTVIITVEHKDGTRQTAPCHTIDGEWNQSMKGMGKVLAWMPLPEPWKGEE